MTVVTRSCKVGVIEFPDPGAHPLMRVALDSDQLRRRGQRFGHREALERQRDIVDRPIRIVVLWMRVVQDRIVGRDLDLLADARALHPRREHALVIHERDRLAR